MKIRLFSPWRLVITSGPLEIIREPKLPGFKVDLVFLAQPLHCSRKSMRNLNFKKKKQLQMSCIKKLPT